MNKFNFNKAKSGLKRGFTLVELIVSIGLFGAVAVLISGSLVNMMGIHSQVENKQYILNDFRSGLDLMSREISSGAAFQGDCEDGCDQLFFFTRIRPDMPLRYIHYRLEESEDGTTRILKAEQDESEYLDQEEECRASGDEFEDGRLPFDEDCYEPVSSEFIDIQNLRFYIANYDKKESGDFIGFGHPNITIVIDGQVVLPTGSSSFRTAASTSPRHRLNPDARPPADTTRPIVNIKQPVTNKEKYTTTGTQVKISGEAFDSVSGLKSLSWRLTDENGDSITDEPYVLEFDGQNDHVQITPDSLAADDPVSVAFWINTDWDQRQMIIQYNNIIDFTIGTHDSGTGRFLARSPSGDTFNRYRFSNNEWQHVVVVFNSEGDFDAVYRNGSEVSNRFDEQGYTNTGYTVGDTETLIGKRGGDTHYMGGKLSDVRIYNRTLSASEAQALYDNHSISNNNLIGHWQFNEGSGTTAFDNSTNNNHGTVNGANWVTDENISSGGSQSFPPELFEEGETEVVDWEVDIDYLLPGLERNRFTVVAEDTNDNKGSAYIDIYSEDPPPPPPSPSLTENRIQCFEGLPEYVEIDITGSSYQEDYQAVLEDSDEGVWSEINSQTINQSGDTVTITDPVDHFFTNGQTEIDRTYRAKSQWNSGELDWGELESDPSDPPLEVTIKASDCHPEEPTIRAKLSCDGTDPQAQIDLTADNDQVKEFKIYRDDQVIATTTQSSYSFTDPLDRGEEYSYRVEACTANGDCTPSAETEVRTTAKTCTPPDLVISDLEANSCQYQTENDEYSYQIRLSITKEEHEEADHLRPYDENKITVKHCSGSNCTKEEDFSTLDHIDSLGTHSLSATTTALSDSRDHYFIAYAEYDGEKGVPTEKKSDPPVNEPNLCQPALSFDSQTTFNCDPLQGEIWVRNPDQGEITVQRLRKEIEIEGETAPEVTVDSVEWEDPSWSATTSPETKGDLWQTTPDGYVFFDQAREEADAFALDYHYYYRARSCIDDNCSEWTGLSTAVVEEEENTEEEEDLAHTLSDSYCDLPPPGIEIDKTCDRATGEILEFIITGGERYYEENVKNVEYIDGFRIYRCIGSTDNESSCDKTHEAEKLLTEIDVGGEKRFTYNDDFTEAGNEPEIGWYFYRIEAFSNDEDYEGVLGQSTQSIELAEDICTPVKAEAVIADLECVSDEPYRQLNIDLEVSDLTSVDHFDIYECPNSEDNCSASDSPIASCDYDPAWEEGWDSNEDPPTTVECLSQDLNNNSGTYYYKALACDGEECLEYEEGISDPSEPVLIEEDTCIPQRPTLTALDLRQSCVDLDEEPAVEASVEVEHGDYTTESKTYVELFRGEGGAEPVINETPYKTITASDLAEWLSLTDHSAGKEYTYGARACNSELEPECHDELDPDHLRSLNVEEDICPPEIDSLDAVRSCDPLGVDLSIEGEYYQGFVYTRCEGSGCTPSNESAAGTVCEANSCRDEDEIENQGTYNYRAWSYQDNNGNRIYSDSNQTTNTTVDCDLDGYELDTDRYRLQVSTWEDGGEVTSSSIYPKVTITDSNMNGQDIAFGLVEVSESNIPAGIQENHEQLAQDINNGHSFSPSTVTDVRQDQEYETEFNITIPNLEYVADDSCETIPLTIETTNSISKDQELDVTFEICDQGATDL